MKRSLTILLTIALLFTSIPTVRTAAEEDGFIDDSLQTLETIVEETEELSEEQEPVKEENDGFVIPPLTFHGGTMDTEPLKHHREADSIQETLPSSYDLRNYGLVTSVKDQNPYGTCWTFAALASAESGVLNKYGRTLDLAELQVAYYTWNSYNKADPLNLITKDGNTMRSTDTSTTSLDAGGYDFTADFALASGIGFSDESMYPYSQARTYASGSGSQPCYNTKYRLRSARWLSMSEPETVKSYLMNYGALAVSYYHDDYYLSNNYAYYENETVYTNHAVTLVGWDDNYSRNRFNSYCRPSGNGAWLIKNSWGSGWGNSGYFWISYYDTSIRNCMAIFYEAEIDDSYDANDYHIYQYDGSSNEFAYQEYSSSIYQSNIYTSVNKEELLSDVGFFVYGSEIDYTISVYKDLTSNKPTAGTLACKQSGYLKDGGYYLIPLNDEVILKQGEKYSVVVKLSSGNGESFLVLNDQSDSWDIQWYDYYGNRYKDTYNFYNDTSKDLSYYSSNGSNWYSLTSSGQTARIKAVTKDLEEITDYRAIRLAGSDRIETAIKTATEIKDLLGEDKLDYVILAYAWNFPDALGGSYLAAMTEAPILLIDKGSSSRVCSFIKDNLADDGIIFVLGGEKAVSSEWLTSLADYELFRFEGEDRFGTNLDILESVGISSSWPILVCSGWSFADSLSAGATGLPILLVSTSLSEEQKNFLSEHSNCRIFIVGGTSAVSEKVEREINEIATVYGRIAGEDRYGTSVAMAQAAFPASDRAVLAYAWNFPDGLSSGPLAFLLQAPIILTDGKNYGLAQEYCQEKGITRGYLMGGSSLVTDAAAKAIFALSTVREILVR